MEDYVGYAWRSRFKVMDSSKHLLPTTAAGLIDGSLYSPLTVNKSKLSQVALKILSTARIEQSRSLASPSLLTDDGRLTPADVIQANSHSFAGRIFASIKPAAVVGSKCLT